MGSGDLIVAFADEHLTISESSGGLTFGRGATLDIDSNPFLHREVGRFIDIGDVWWVENRSRSSSLRLNAGGFSTLVPPRTRAPLTDQDVEVEFEAGPCRYHLDLHLEVPPTPVRDTESSHDERTMTRRPGYLHLSDEERVMCAVLAESVLRDPSRIVDLPRNDAAADRLGWTLTKFNRKLDQLCLKVHRLGIPGMRTSSGRATGRRLHLVNYLVSSEIITADDLALLDPLDAATSAQ